jgi:hypothetical protein
MRIRDFYLNDETGGLYIEFSTKEDGDDFYRTLELTYDEVTYYSPTIVEDLEDVDEDLMLEIIVEYSKENDLPEEISL